MFKILVYDDQAKIRSLEEYLFDKITNQTPPGPTASDGGQYVVFKGDANIRNKTHPYELVAPASFLTKGKEVELISHRTDSESPRALVKYVGDTIEYCTSLGNLMKINVVDDVDLYKLKQASAPLQSPYSEDVGDELSTDITLIITHECGVYKRVKKKENLEDVGWFESQELRKFVDIENMSVSEFKTRFEAAATSAVNVIKGKYEVNEAACNLCVRAALRNLTGVDVLFPTIGSSVTIKILG